MTQKILFFVNWPAGAACGSDSDSSGSSSDSQLNFNSFDQTIEVTSLDREPNETQSQGKQNLMKWIKGKTNENSKKKRKFRSRIYSKYDLLYGPYM